MMCVAANSILCRLALAPGLKRTNQFEHIASALPLLPDIKRACRDGRVVPVHPFSYAGNRGSFNVSGHWDISKSCGRADISSTHYLADATNIIAMIAAQCVPASYAL
jgi:hypothetical protein